MTRAEHLLKARGPCEPVDFCRSVVGCDVDPRHEIRIGMTRAGDIVHLESDCESVAGDAARRLGAVSCGALAYAIRDALANDLKTPSKSWDAPASPLERGVLEAAIRKADERARAVRSERKSERHALGKPAPDWRSVMLARFASSTIGVPCVANFDARTVSLGSYFYYSERKRPVAFRDRDGFWCADENVVRRHARGVGRKAKRCVVCQEDYQHVGTHLNGRAHADRLLSRVKEMAHFLNAARSGREARLAA